MKGLHITAGVIDQGYTGEVKVLVTNLTGTVQTIEKNTRFAQIVFMPYMVEDLVVIDENLIPETVRGQFGFGSTGNE